MREIKFRAWDESQEIMHFDFQFWKSGDKGNDWIMFVSDKQRYSDGVNNPYFRQQLKIMQFTGLLDKNGKEIFEGDVLYACLNDNKYILKYGDWACEYDESHPKGRHYGWYLQDKSDFCEGLSDEPLLEVIGNIYENPELLK